MEERSGNGNALRAQLRGQEMMSEIATPNGLSTVEWNASDADSSAEAIDALLIQEFAADAGDAEFETRIRAASYCNLTAARRLAVVPCPGWKRTIDILGAGCTLIILFPVFVCLGVFIKCVSRGPVFYRQLRYGLAGRPFKVWKFRTIEASHSGHDHHVHVADLMASDRPLEKRDHRLAIIRGGAMLRNFGIDELPQLINVLVGEMSLVGPRPDVVPFEQYESWHRRRFEVLPGITGLWQVRGKNRTTFSQMMQLDLAYVRRRSLWLDISILAWTIPALLSD